MVVEVHDEETIAGHAHTAAKRRNHRGGTGIGQRDEAGVHRNVDERSRIGGAPDRGGDSALGQAVEVGFEGGERMVGHDIMVQRRPEPKDVKNEALDALPMRRSRRAGVVYSGSPVKAKRGGLNPESELLKKVDDLSVGGGAHANGEDRVRCKGGGKTMEDGKGRVCRARRAPVEREVEGHELHPPRARGPGEG